jgi:biopolymer transport protein TolR
MGMNVGSGGKGKRKPSSDINVTPLVDVMLVLLVIFMITASASREQIPLDLPSGGGEPDNPEKAGMSINIDSASKVYVDKKVLDFTQVDDELPKLLKGREKEIITLNAHRTLPYEAVIKVISAIRRAGVEGINMSVDASAK